MKYLTKGQALFVLLVLISIAVLAGCGTTSENTRPYITGFVHQENGDSLAACSDENSGFRLGVERRVTEYFKTGLEYMHISHLLCGRPFGDSTDQDESVDSWGWYFTIGGT